MASSPPTSVKAALRSPAGWVLLRNERNEWELPGGRIDPDDRSLQATVRRECREELGIDVEVGELIDTWLYEVLPGKRVVIVCFAAQTTATSLTVSHEHLEARFAIDAELVSLNVADGYRRAMRLASS